MSVKGVCSARVREREPVDVSQDPGAAGPVRLVTALVTAGTVFSIVQTLAQSTRRHGACAVSDIQ